nr:ATP-binding cassette domain-containing protein [Lachnospiraceae bacterium]
MILSVQHVKKAFGGDVIFSDASFQIDTKEKIAIVGKNGTGKSTLLKMIVGQETRDDGDIIFGKDISFGYLAQYQDFDENGTIYDIVLSSREDLLEKERELRAMEGNMKDLSNSDLQAFLNTYEKKTKEFTDAGGETYRSEAAGILKGLGFSDDELSKEFSMLSGGQKTRVSLGRLLMRKPDILILDEPINHLDLSSIEWLEGYLKKLDSTLIL